MKRGSNIRPLYGPHEDDWIPGDDFDFVPKSSPSESEKVVPFNQPLDAIAMGVQLVQVLPMLQQISQQVAVLTAKMERLERQRLSPPPRSDFDEVAYLDAEGARKYLSMSKNTFEKHVYLAKIKVPRHAVGGKNLFKKKDLDLFVQTWEDKNRP